MDSIGVNVDDVTPSLGESASLLCSYQPLSPRQPNIYWTRRLSGSEDEEQIARYHQNGDVEVRVFG